MSKAVTGRSTDVFKTEDGGTIHGGYFIYQMHHREWVTTFQVIQRSRTLIVFRIVGTDIAAHQQELDEIRRKVKLVMGPNSAVEFEFVDEILPSASGTILYTISELQDWPAVAIDT